MILLSWIAVAITLISSTSILIARNWRISLVWLAAQYLAMFILLLSHAPLGTALVKLIAGWVSCAVIGMTRSSLPNNPAGQGIWPRARLFRLFAAGAVGVIVVGIAPSVNHIMADVGAAVVSGALLLAGIGLLHLGMTSRILRVAQGLLTTLAGFEILYAAVEGSALITAALAAITLGIALVGAYLMIASRSIPVEAS